MRPEPLVVLLAATLGAACAAQTVAPSGEPVIRANVRQVLVPVVVTDRKGHHVDGLTARDFTVYEDGAAQDIVAFQSAEDLSAATLAPGSAAPAQAANTAAAPPGLPRRTYLVLVDMLHSEFANFGRLRSSLAKFFAGESAADSQYVLIALGRSARVVQDSTRDPASIVAAVRGEKFSGMLGDTETMKTSDETHQFTTLMQSYCAACGCSNYPAIGNERPMCGARSNAVQQFLNASSARTWALTENFLGSIDQMVAALAGMPGSRTVLFISDGWNRFPGRDLYTILTSFGPLDGSIQLNPRDTQDRFQAMLKNAVRDDVRFYALDSRGLYTQASLASGGEFDASHGMQESRAGRPTGSAPAFDSMQRATAEEDSDELARLAIATGGLFYHNSNDMLRGIRRAFDDGREYYILAYAPKNRAQDGAFRKITVEVKNPKLSVLAKAGYWATAN